MDDVEVVFHSYGPLDHETFKRSLRDLDFQDPNWLYQPVASEEPWQGDVFPSGEVGQLVESGQVGVVEAPVMLLSHGCDAVPGQEEFATLAPVWPLSELGLSGAWTDQRLNDLRSNRFTNLFYLPACGDLPESFVDFLQAGAVSTDYLARLARETPLQSKLRLREGGWYLLTGKLAHHVARVEDPGDYPRDR
jgi:hypothetical protein